MHISKNLSHFLFALILFISSLAVIPEKAYASVASKKAAKAKVTKLLKTDPKVRKAFHDYIVGYYLHVYLDTLWHAIYDIPSDLIHVANCVKGAESGNYAESSHPGSGSGAYQYTPPTWKHYFGLWRDATGYKFSYQLAFMAPWYVQDATFVYTLRHDGASNWSNDYGYDPCTAGM